MIKRTVVKRNYICFTVFRDIDKNGDDIDFREKFADYLSYPITTNFRSFFTFLSSAPTETDFDLSKKQNDNQTRKYIKEEVYECLCVDCCFFSMDCYEELNNSRWVIFYDSMRYFLLSNYEIFNMSNFELARSDCCVFNRIGPFISCYTPLLCLISRLLLNPTGINEVTKSTGNGYRADYGIVHKKFLIIDKRSNWAENRNIEITLEDNLNSYSEESTNYAYKHERDGSAMHGAVLNNNLLLIYVLFRYFEADLNVIDDGDGETPLHHSSTTHKYVKMKTFEYLLHLGADVNKETESHGHTPLHIACRDYSVDSNDYLDKRAVELVENGSDPNKKNKHDKTPLDLAADKGVLFRSLELCTELNKMELSDKPLNYKAETVLHFAVKKELSFEFIESLLSKGADPNNRGNEKESAFHLCIVSDREDSADLCILMLDNNADPNSVDLNGTPALNLAIQNKLFTTIPKFIEKNVDQTLTDKNNYTALYLSCDICHESTCLLLLRANPNINRVVNTKPPFHLAIEKNMPNSCIAEFLKTDVHLDALDSDKNTVLHVSCISERIDICEKILKNGRINPNLLNASGQAALHISVTKGIDICTALLEFGGDKIDINLQNDSKKTSLEIALDKKHKNWEIINLLIHNGAIFDPYDFKKKYFNSHQESYKYFYMNCEFTLEALKFDQYRLWFYLIEIQDIDNIEKRNCSYAEKYDILLKAIDNKGRIAENIAPKKQQEVLKNIYLWHNRFRVTDTPIHVSATCFVYRAEDEGDKDKDGHPKSVALKLMNLKSHFGRELSARKHKFKPIHVVEVKDTFPNSIDLENINDTEEVDIDQIAQKEGREYLKLSKTQAEKMYCLVMPLADTNMYVAMKQERWAGLRNKNDIDFVKHVGKQILNCLMHIHKRGVLHGDIKPLNLVRIESHWRLIDMDASCELNKQTVGLKYSTAYVPPEFLYKLPESAGSTDGLVIVKTKDKLRENQIGLSECPLLIAHASFDIWAFGCVLYQLCNENIAPIFPADKDDNLSSENLLELYNWNDQIKYNKMEKIKDRFAKNVISQILVENPSKRPSIERILAHPFFSNASTTRLIGEEAEFDVFLSYRVDSDKDHVGRLYELLTKRGLKVWWDKKCLVDGIDWEAGFCKGLINSKIFVCILSRNAIKNPQKDNQNFEKLTENSKCDNVFLEYRLALELKKLELLTFIFPLMIGDREPDNPNNYKNYFSSGCSPVAPEVIVKSVEEKLCKHMLEQGLGTPVTTNETVGSVLKEITNCQGAPIEGDGTIAFEAAADRIASIINDQKQRSNVVNAPVNEELKSLKQKVAELELENQTLKSKDKRKLVANALEGITREDAIHNKQQPIILTRPNNNKILPSP